MRDRQDGTLFITGSHHLNEAHVYHNFPETDIIGPLPETAQAATQVEVWAIDWGEYKVYRTWVSKSNVKFYHTTFESAKTRILMTLEEKVDAASKTYVRLEKKLIALKALTEQDARMTK